jgi:hypothetical protein
MFNLSDDYANSRAELERAIEAYNQALDSKDLAAIQKLKIDVEGIWERLTGQKVKLPSPEEQPGEHLVLEMATPEKVARESKQHESETEDS